MRMRITRGLWLAVALAVGGCGGSAAPEPEPVVAEDTTTRLGDKTDIALTDLLAKPRLELAKLAEDKEQTIARLQEFQRQNPEAVDLLPRLHPSVRVPVFQKAAFAESAGFSLPPYVK